MTAKIINLEAVRRNAKIERDPRYKACRALNDTILDLFGDGFDQDTIVFALQEHLRHFAEQDRIMAELLPAIE